MPNLWTRLVGAFGGRAPAQRTDAPPPSAPATQAAPVAPAVPKGPTEAQKALASDQVDATPRAKDVGTARTVQQQAVAELRQIIAGGKLDYYLEAEQKTGKLLHPEAEKLFAALPVMTSATTAKQLFDVGLISKIPEGVEKMWGETPRYFVGRQILVSAPVDTDHSGSSFHTYQEGGETRATHRAYIVGEQGNNFQVMVEGREKPLTVAKRDVYKLNEGHTIDGERGKAWGVDIDYKNDVILKAKIAAAMIKLDDLIGKLDFRTVDKAVTQKALAEVPKPGAGELALEGLGKMIRVSPYSQDGVGDLSPNVHASLRKLFTAVGGNTDEVGPSVQRLLNTLVGADGRAKDLASLDWPAFAQDMQTAVAKDRTLALQREALTTLHGQINMQHPASVYGSFGTNYRPPAGGNGEAGKLANGGIGVCNLQASVLFALLQPFKHVLGYETQLEMGCCIHPRAGRNGGTDKNPPHGWVIASMWPSGERFVSDRTWHHPCLALDYAFSPSGDRRHVTWDPNVRQNTVVTSKDIDMTGTFAGAKPMPVGDKAAHGRPDH